MLQCTWADGKVWGPQAGCTYLALHLECVVLQIKVEYCDDGNRLERWGREEEMVVDVVGRLARSAWVGRVEGRKEVASVMLKGGVDGGCENCVENG